MIHIRKYHSSDLEPVIRLFQETVQTITAPDYTQEQRDVWAPREFSEEKKILWNRSFEKNHTYVAHIDSKIVGFADLEDSGYVDRLFVHKDFQRQGIATLLLATVEKKAKELQLHEIFTESSVTAKPFFEHHGFQVEKSQQKEYNGQIFLNYCMRKKL